MLVQFPFASAIYSALSVILVIGLALRVVFSRRAARVGLGDGGDARLSRHIRAHGNAVENLPLALLLLVLLEMTGVAAVWIHVLGTLLLLGRVGHALGIGANAGVSFGRFYGAALSWLVMLGSAVWLLVRLLVV